MLTSIESHIFAQQLSSFRVAIKKFMNFYSNLRLLWYSANTFQIFSETRKLQMNKHIEYASHTRMKQDTSQIVQK